MTQVGDLRSQGRVCGSLGSIHSLQGEFQAAVEYYTKVRPVESAPVRSLLLPPCVCAALQRLEADNQLGDDHALWKTYVNLGNTHLCLSQYSEAEQCYQ